MVKISESIEDPYAYTLLTDSVLEHLKLSDDSNLDKVGACTWRVFGFLILHLFRLKNCLIKLKSVYCTNLLDRHNVAKITK